jgi:hypothetical protein
MSQGCLSFFDPSERNYAEWATGLRLEYSARRKSGPRTSGSGFSSSDGMTREEGSWPTPEATLQKSHRQHYGESRNAALPLAAENWQTPVVNDALGSQYSYPSGNHDKPFLKLTGQAEYWPTPGGMVSNDGESLESWEARKRKLEEKGYNGNGMGTPLSVASQMWGTPGAEMGGEVAHPRPSRGGEMTEYLSRQVAMWPTPEASMQKTNKREPWRDRSVLLPMAAETWPTPQAFDADGPDQTAEAREKRLEKGGCRNLREDAVLWRSPSAQEAGIKTERLEGELGHRMYDKDTGRLAQHGLNQQAELWQTPNVPNGGRSAAHAEMVGNTAYHEGKKVQLGLEHQTRMWISPKAPSGGGQEERTTKGGGLRKLEDQAEFWPTPQVTTSGMEASNAQVERIRAGVESERGAGACKLEITASLFGL